MSKWRDLNNFWNKINKTDSCWLWMSSTVKGYGQFGFGGKMFLSHRFMWELKFGSIPPGLQVCHKCDVPLCVNPDHLWLGTAKDNIRDCWNKKRKNHQGENHPACRLSDEQVKQIRQEYSFGNGKEVSEKFKISRGYLSEIIHNEKRKEKENVKF